jgi:hypothetical protein
MLFGSAPSAPRRILPLMSWKNWGSQGRNGWNGWNGWNGQDWRSDSTAASASKKPFWRRFVDASEDPAVIQWCRQRIQQFLDSGSSQENMEWLGNETQTRIRRSLRSFFCFRGGLGPKYIWSRPPSLHPPSPPHGLGPQVAPPLSLLFASYWQHF